MSGALHLNMQRMRLTTMSLDESLLSLYMYLQQLQYCNNNDTTITHEYF